MCPPPLVSEGRGPHLGAQQASWAQVGGVNALLSSPAPLVWGLGNPLLPASPDLPGHPPMSPGPMQVWGRRGSLGGQGTGLGAQQAPWAPVGRAIALHFSPAPPGWPLPPATPDLLGLPPMPAGPTLPGWGFGGGGTDLGAQQAPPPEWARRSPSAPLLLFLESPSHLPLLISPSSGAPILSGLHFSSPPSVPLCPTSSLWGSSRLLGGQSSPPAAGGHPSCGETLTPHFPTPTS